MSDMSTGFCVGGPLDGEHVTVRTPDGFLAVDTAAGLAWKYQRETAGQFAVCTDHDASLIYPQGAVSGVRRLNAVRVWQAGVNSDLDIVAVGGG